MSTSTITGSIGGVSINSLISAADAANRSRAVTLSSQVDTISIQSAATTNLQNDLQSLDGYLVTLSDPQFFRAKTASVSDSTVGYATADTSLASDGSYDIDISQVATDSVYRSSKATPLATASSTVQSVFGATAAGTIYVGTAGSGTTALTISATSTMAQVAAQLQSAISGSTVTFSNGKFNITGSDSLILSSGTSTILQQAQLYNGYSARSASGTTLTGSETVSAAYGSAFVNGTFNLNGVAVQVNGTDTIQNVIDRINAQVPGVTASLVSGRLTINSASTISVSNGTGSFFNQAGLATSSATSTSSATAVGSRNLTDTLPNNGTLTVNGVAVAYSTTDTLQDLLNNITNSGAGVAATYDSYNDQIVLTASSTGPTSISVSDSGNGVAGQGLADFGLGGSDGAFTAGNSTVFSVDGGPQRVSASNVLDSTALGLTGITFTANKAGDTTLVVSADVAAIKLGIDNFINGYNIIQNEIASDVTINSTNPSLDGVLNNDPTVVDMPQQLRELLDTVFSSNTAVLSLQDLGITGNENDDTATTSDATQLTSALTSNLQEVINLFTDGNSGIVIQMEDYVNAMSLGDSSVLGSEVSNDTSQITYLQSQIAQVNAAADMQKTQLQNEYANYESVYANNQSSMSYLSSGSGSSSSSSGSSNVLG